SPLSANGGGGTEIVNLAPGLEARGSQAAVNGDQLFAVNEVAAKAYQDANLALGIVEGLDFDNLPDGPTNYYKTRSQYVQGGVAFLPRGGLDTLFNPSFEINSITAPGTACKLVGQQPSDGWLISQSDTDGGGNAYWSAAVLNASAEDGNYCLAFTPTAGLVIPASVNPTMALKSLPMKGVASAYVTLSNWVQCLSSIATALPTSVSVRCSVILEEYDPAGGPASAVYLHYTEWEGSSGPYSNPPAGSWYLQNQFDTHNNNALQVTEPLFYVSIQVALLNTGGAFTIPSLPNLLLVDNITCQYPVNLGAGSGATQSVTGALAGTVASFQSGTVVITPAVGAQVTTNVTLGTAVVTAKSMVSINWDSATATVSAPGSNATLTTGTNLQIVTDAQIGGTAANVNLNWQVLTWN
ncbi:MAG: hypothetical protein B7Z74_04580, partial [Deltaproteobacteria bacterium 21-66-5]